VAPAVVAALAEAGATSSVCRRASIVVDSASTRDGGLEPRRRRRILVHGVRRIDEDEVVLEPLGAQQGGSLEGIARHDLRPVGEPELGQVALQDFEAPRIRVDEDPESGAPAEGLESHAAAPREQVEDRRALQLRPEDFEDRDSQSCEGGPDVLPRDREELRPAGDASGQDKAPRLRTHGL